MPGFGSITLRDYDKELTVTQFLTGNITALSLPDTLTQWGALRAAIEGVTLGVVANEALKVFDTKLSNDVPVSPQAQRENKWLVLYEDNLPFFDDPVNAIPNAGYRKVFTNEIGTADLTLLVANTNKMNIATGAGATLVAAMETLLRSPYGGTINVLEVRHVGRST